MSDTVLSFSEPQNDIEAEAAFRQMLAEMECLNRQMQDDQAKIERLKAEAGIIKAETDVIKARTQARLESLLKMVQT